MAYTYGPGGARSALDITAATVVKASAGVLYRVSVTTAGSAAGSVYDYASTSGQGASDLVASIPNAVGVTELLWPCNTGILIVPGTGQIVSVSYT